MKKQLNSILMLGLFAASTAAYSNEEVALPDNLFCPAGTTFNAKESKKDRMVCDVAFNDKAVFPLTKDKATFVQEKELKKRVNTSYPEWYTNNGGSGVANENSYHRYFTLMEPGVDAPAHDSENIACYSIYIKPGKTYFAHNHPSREFYFVFGGEGNWFGGDESKPVEKGTFIVHPPYLSHGFVNTSETEELGAFVCWWRNSKDYDTSMDHGGLPTNPCLVDEEGTANPGATKSVCENEK